MKKRLKVYLLHSNKIDYNNLLYKPILSNSTCLSQDLILPYSTNYVTKYAKELINIADIIIVDTSKDNFTFKLELKWAIATKKPIKFISITNNIAKGLKKYVNEIELYDENKSIDNIIENFINQNQNVKNEDKKDTSIIIGQI